MIKEYISSKRVSGEKMSGGYIGLIMLLISVAIIAFLIIRTDLFSGQPNSKNMIEGGFDAIDAAKNAKNLIEQNNRKVGEY